MLAAAAVAGLTGCATVGRTCTVRHRYAIVLFSKGAGIIGKGHVSRFRPGEGQALAHRAGQPASSSSRAWANACAATSRSSRVCAALTCVLIRALPIGTTG